MTVSSLLTVRAAGERWFAVSVRSNHEKAVAAALRAKGFREFLPLYRARRLRFDRVADIDLPLFPGYLFVSFDPHVRDNLVVATTGVLGLVGVGRTPCPVEDHEIAAIHSILVSGLAAEPWPFVAPGSPVRVLHGPLAGVEGILVEVRKKHRLVISVTLLQRSVAVDIDSAWARPLVSPAAPALSPVRTVSDAA